MKRFGRKSHVGKVIAAALIGSVVGATVGLLMAPTSGREMRRRIGGSVVEARERTKAAAGNIESKTRELAEEVKEDLNTAAGSVSRRRKVAPAGR